MATLNISIFNASARERYGQDIDGPSRVIGELTFPDLQKGPVPKRVTSQTDAVLAFKLQRHQTQRRIGDLILLVGLVVLAIFALYAIGALIALRPMAFAMRGTLLAGSFLLTLAGHTAYGLFSGHSALREELVQQAAIRLQQSPLASG